MFEEHEARITFLGTTTNHMIYNYVVIITRFNGKLVWVRQKGRTTWEIPGGHVEQNEFPEQAAQRELREETGATQFTMSSLCDFIIEIGANRSYNRLFFADVIKMGYLKDSEIEEVEFFERIPSLLTHGHIQPLLLIEAKKYIENL